MLVQHIFTATRRRSHKKNIADQQVVELSLVVVGARQVRCCGWWSTEMRVHHHDVRAGGAKAIVSVCVAYIQCLYMEIH